MAAHSTTVTLKSAAEVFDLLLTLRGKQWLSRGHSKPHALKPTIDRGRKWSRLSRREQLARERSSINLFRETARFFAGSGEQVALLDDIVALMVVRHYGVPTRLLDWSLSPHVSAYFAVERHDTRDGELWAFDRAHFEVAAREQWQLHPETTSDRSGDPEKFEAGLTAFSVDEPPDWITTGHYYSRGFPRQDAQSGAYTITSRFGRDHMKMLRNVLKDDSKHRRYVIPARLKKTVRQILREQHGVWRGTLFPDSAGAAQTACGAFR